LLSILACWVIFQHNHHPKFYVKRFRGFRVRTPPILQFSIGLASLPDNSISTTVLYHDHTLKGNSKMCRQYDGNCQLTDVNLMEKSTNLKKTTSPHPVDGPDIQTQDTDC